MSGVGVNKKQITKMLFCEQKAAFTGAASAIGRRYNGSYLKTLRLQKDTEGLWVTKSRAGDRVLLS